MLLRLVNLSFNVEVNLSDQNLVVDSPLPSVALNDLVVDPLTIDNWWQLSRINQVS